ncbi:MAG: hypothetical protein ACK571_16525, partial [Pseudanabaena sp.]
MQTPRIGVISPRNLIISSDTPYYSGRPIKILWEALIGAAQLQSGNPDQAITNLQNASSLDPNLPDADY